MNELDELIGISVPRVDGREKVTGSARYVDDLYRPNMLHGARLGSPYAHARIVSCDTSRAKALPGVKAVLTGQDLPDNLFGVAVSDERVLARDKVRYVGEPVAAVAAVDLQTAKAALRLIDIEYEVLPAVFDPQEAMAPDAPLLHEQFDRYFRNYDSPAQGNVLGSIELSTGNVDSAWESCDVIVEGEYETPAVQHLYMEPCGALAEVDGRGKVTIWSSTQSVFSVQATVARALDLPMSKVRCIAPKVGGGFGGKFVTVEPIAAALAMATGAPVKLVLSREEDMTTMRSRHASRIRIRTGAKADGALVCREVHVVLDAGAYADMSPLVLSAAVLLAPGPYRIPNVRSAGRAVYTNRLRASAMRGFGAIQPNFAGETQLDELAAKLGMDPIDLRIKNALRSGDKWLGSHHLPVCEVAQCLEAIRAHPAWQARHRRPVDAGKRRGFGVAAVVQQSGIFSASASVRLNEDGSLTVSTGYVDIGNGSDTTLSQICAASLGVPIEHINLVSADTDGAAYDFGTAADRGTHGVGLAVQQAAMRVKEQLFRFAGEMLECAPEDLELRPGGKVAIKGVPQPELRFGDIAARGLYAGGGPIIGTHAYYMQEPQLDPTQTASVGFRMGGGVHYGFAAHAVEVEVDEATGQVEVIQGWAAHDLGRVMNRNGAEGQIIGGFIQAVGGALFEELVWDDGRLANPSLMDYKIPGALDAPYDIHCIVLENPEPEAPWGARGLSDPCIIGPGSAIANALADAGIPRIHQMPLTSERVLRALLSDAEH
ncbi:MAG: xanthine dehydrogenase family protein molybdopterin-binding subunit [Wenzhouxiangellaceae bacterium]